MAGGYGHSRATLAPRSSPGWRHRLSNEGPPAEVQVFGRRDSRDTQKTLRFFRERQIRTVFVDLATKPMAPTELRRFATRFSPKALLDESSRAFRDAGLGYMRLDDDELMARLLANQALLRLPLVRAGSRLSIGLDEPAWRGWVTAP